MFQHDYMTANMTYGCGLNYSVTGMPGVSSDRERWRRGQRLQHPVSPLAVAATRAARHRL